MEHRSLRRSFSGLLFGFGCALTFIGLLALILPAIANAQMQLVLASFRLPSENLLVRVINTGMAFALDHAWQVLVVGAAALVVGVVLFCAFAPQEQRAAAQPEQQPILWANDPPPPPRPNPFADLNLWEHQFAPEKQVETPKPAATPYTGFGELLLERNRIEAESPAVPPTFEPPMQEDAPAFATPEPALPPEPVVETPQPAETPPLPKAEEIDIHDEAALAKYFTPNEEQPAPQIVSSRIRSTMGRRST